MAPSRTFKDGLSVEVDSSAKIMVKAHPDFAKELGKVAREIADVARKIVRAEHTQTGKMERSIQPYRGRAANVRKTGPTTITADVTAGSSRAKYTKWVHEGSVPHVIRAKAGKMLVFKTTLGRTTRSRTFARSRLRLMNDEEWDYLEGAGVGDEFGAAVARNNRRVADIAHGRNSIMRRRDADTVEDVEDVDYANRTVVTPMVNHPGYQGHRFLNQAAAIVVGGKYGGAVNLPRRSTGAIKSR